MGVVNRGVAVGDFHAPPAFERREQHEQIRDSIALVLVIVARLAPRLGGNSRARLDNQLFRSFVEAHDGALGITRSLVDFQHVFHVGNEGRVGVRRDHPLLLEMRLENVFLRVLPIVLSLARWTMLSSTTFSSSRRRLHLACPSGAGPHVSAISFASAAPSNIRGRAEFGLYLRVSTDSNPSSTNWRLVRSILAMLVSSASAIRLSLQPSPAADTSAFSRIRAFVNNCAGRLPAWTKSSSRARSSALNRTTYFLTATSFVATNRLRRWIATTVIQNTPSNAMTRATRCFGRIIGCKAQPAPSCAKTWRFPTRSWCCARAISARSILIRRSTKTIARRIPGSPDTCANATSDGCFSPASPSTSVCAIPRKMRAARVPRRS